MRKIILLLFAAMTLSGVASAHGISSTSGSDAKAPFSIKAYAVRVIRSVQDCQSIMS